MQTDPIMEWQRLTEHYRGLCDEELCELAIAIDDLTDTAQQALRQELRSRRLGEPEAAIQTLRDSERLRTAGNGEAMELEQEGLEEPESEKSGGVDYTWKTLLCECEERIQAVELYLALKRIGIESWSEAGGEDGIYTRVLVAADQLDEARRVAEQPIPWDVQEEAKEMMEPREEYEPPVCPECGTADPILEAAEPMNEWLCEACGAEWAEAE